MPPTQLTDPVVKYSATQATLDAVTLTLARGPDGVTVDVDRTALRVELAFRDAAGAIVEVRKFDRAPTSWPAPLRAAARDFHASLVTALRSAGILPPGSDSDDLP
jgi:hypothetical protein